MKRSPEIRELLLGSTSENSIIRTGENLAYSHLNYFIFNFRKKCRIPTILEFKIYFINQIKNIHSPSLKNTEGYIRAAINKSILEDEIIPETDFFQS